MDEFEKEQDTVTEEDITGYTVIEPKKKKKGMLSGFLLGLITAVILCSAAFTVFMVLKSKKPEETEKESTGILSEYAEDKINAIQELIDQVFLFDKENIDFDSNLIKAYVEAYNDPYTVYYTKDEFDTLMESTSGTYSGIGVVVQQNASTGVITVINPYENAPGAKAGMQVGDIIYKVEGEEVTGIDINLVVAKIKGEEGTSVSIEVYRPSEDRYIKMNVVRETIEIQTIAYKMLDHNIGYIEMSSFDEVTYTQFYDAYKDLSGQGMQALIFDIRDNGGGLLSTALNILDVLLPSGLLLYTQDVNGKKETYSSNAYSMLNIPMVLLVNGNSASASEIVTGVLKEYKAATIMGTQTFGKGIVQQFYQFNDGSAIKITVSRYYLPSGICIHGEGITPDIIVEDDLTKNGDEQLEAAIEYLLNLNQ